MQNTLAIQNQIRIKQLTIDKIQREIDDHVMQRTVHKAKLQEIINYERKYNKGEKKDKKSGKTYVYLIAVYRDLADQTIEHDINQANRFSSRSFGKIEKFDFYYINNKQEEIENILKEIEILKDQLAGER